MKYIYFAVLLCGIAGVNSEAPGTQCKTGADLLAQCQVVNKSDPGDFEMVRGIQCATYLKGMSDTFAMWKALNDERKGNNPPPACVSAEATGRELSMVVVKYLTDNPTLLHSLYSVAALSALHASYPCD
jgi:hypothetical protein